jgi:cytochrome c biogenesis protein CcmG, thiol:disulfide interchange protein DsbE
MRHRFALLALLVALVSAAAACAGDPPAGQPAAAPATTAAGPATTAPPVTTEAAPETSRPAPKGVIPAGRRQPAPVLRVTDFDGHAIDLAELKGRPVVVNFFESWCVVCRAEQDFVDEVARRYQGEVQFVGVSNNDTVSEGRKYQRHFGVPYPLANDSSGQTWAAWGVPYQPVTVVVDEHGRVVRRFDGGIEDKDLAPVLEYLVGV